MVEGRWVRATSGARTHKKEHESADDEVLRQKEAMQAVEGNTQCSAILSGLEGQRAGPVGKRMRKGCRFSQTPLT